MNNATNRALILIRKGNNAPGGMFTALTWEYFSPTDSDYVFRFDQPAVDSQKGSSYTLLGSGVTGCDAGSSAQLAPSIFAGCSTPKHRTFKVVESVRPCKAVNNSREHAECLIGVAMIS